MTWLTAIFTYFLIWWTALFIVLPIGVKRDENPEKGHDSGAPFKAKLKQKMIITTIISLFIWGVIVLLFETGFLNYRQIVS